MKERAVELKKEACCRGKEDPGQTTRTKKAGVRSPGTKDKQGKVASETSEPDIVLGTPPKLKPSQRNLVFNTPRSVTRRSTRRRSPFASPSTTPLSQDSLSTIHVTENERLFEHFLKEWASQTRFSLAVACERSLEIVPRIGGRFSNVPTCQGTSKGLKIDGDDDAVVGIAVCWGGKDAYFVSLQESTVDDNQTEPAVACSLTVSRRLEAVRSVLGPTSGKQRVKICFDVKEHFKVRAFVREITCILLRVRIGIADNVIIMKATKTRKMSQRYFVPAEYTPKTKPKTNLKP